MLFWKKKKKDKKSEELEEQPLQKEAEPKIEPSTDAPVPDADDVLKPVEDEKVEDIVEEVKETPVPQPVLDEEIEEAKQENQKDDPEKGGWFSRLTKGLSKSSSKISQGITDIFTKKKLDDDTLEELEELLISADLGPKTASKIVDGLRDERFGKEIEPEEIKDFLCAKVEEILEPIAQGLEFSEDKKPYVIVMAGVNGVGKTTTIGKIAYDLKVNQGKSVVLAAGDTFRAAAVEQLKIWGDRTGCDVVAKDIGADAASVAYEAYMKAKEEGADVLMIDTAGRLHNKANLMEELAKIIRVLKKQDESLPHASLLVLDATTGQNAHAQVETFKQMINVSGLIVTKLDGSAKGGVVVSLADHFDLPVHLIGVGEKQEDLRPFRSDEFAKSLLGLS